MTLTVTELDFALDAAREAHEPPEIRGPSRDAVRLLVSDRATGTVTHRRFTELSRLLLPGDLLVVNNSATLPAALPAGKLTVHFSTELPDGTWLAELREPHGDSHRQHHSARIGQVLRVRGGGELELVARQTPRLWAVRLNNSVPIYLAQYGKPIRYSYVDREWPLEKYQTVFATRPGSAEMPSAARPFTADLVAELVSRGVAIAPITLHTGVASLERDEPPYAERFEVTGHTAQQVNATRAAGGRVIAVGTTAVRALESAVGTDGLVHAADGYTDHLVTPATGTRAVDGLLTGLHEPRSTHLLMLQAIAEPRLLADSYHAAIDGGYLWHEFGDVHLIA